ncbi:MAG: hypothetical protein WD969_06515 [Paracoccaceae bacterium]
MRRLLIALALMIAPAAGAQQATQHMPETPELYIVLTPDSAPDRGLFLQQQLVMTVRLVSRYRFESLDLTLPNEIPGADVIRLFRPRTIEVKSYASDGFVFEAGFAIFPTRSGVLIVPPVRAVGMAKSADGEEIRFDHSGPALRIDVGGVPAAYQAEWWMVSDQVNISESWSAPPAEARQGDVLRREVTVTARGVPADRMAPPVHAAARGVEITEISSSIEQQVGPEGVIGVATGAWDILVPEAPVANIAPVRVEFWDLASGAPARKAARALRIEPLSADREAKAAALLLAAEAAHKGARRLALILGGLVCAPLAALCVAAFWRMAPTGADRRLASVCEVAQEPLMILRAVEDWARKTGIDPRAGAPARMMAALDAAVFGRGLAPDGAALARALRAEARRARLAGLRAALAGAARRVFGREIILAGGAA